jgi:hypothetical protein
MLPPYTPAKFLALDIMEIVIKVIDPIVNITVAIDITGVENLTIAETVTTEIAITANVTMVILIVVDTVTKKTYGNKT